MQLQKMYHQPMQLVHVSTRLRRNLPPGYMIFLLVLMHLQAPQETTCRDQKIEHVRNVRIALQSLQSFVCSL